MTEILIDGLTEDELLGLPDDEIRALILRNEPIVFSMGTAKILGQFDIRHNALWVELAEISGGGEGVLLSLKRLATRYAVRSKLSSVEIAVHALTCARPNPKLRPLLERLGFAIVDDPDAGLCLWKSFEVRDACNG